MEKILITIIACNFFIWFMIIPAFGEDNKEYAIKYAISLSFIVLVLFGVTYLYNEIMIKIIALI